MAAIKGRNTKPEIVVRKALHKLGLRFRLHAKLPGTPDLVFPKYRAVLFIHGCFWHRHDCPNGRVLPASRREFWLTKFAANIARDARNCDLLTAAGWSVGTLWECEISPTTIAEACRIIRCKRRHQSRAASTNSQDGPTGASGTAGPRRMLRNQRQIESSDSSEGNTSPPATPSSDQMAMNSGKVRSKDLSHRSRLLDMSECD